MTAVVIGALIVALAAIGLVTGEDDSDQEQSASGPSIAAIARRVERVRQLRFDHLPRVRHPRGVAERDLRAA